MIQKPKIQYVGQFYIYGSEAPALKDKRKKAKTGLPVARPTPVDEIRVEPVAILSIFLAVTLVLVMGVGAIRLYGEVRTYTVMADYADSLAQENTRVRQAYRECVDLSEIESRAKALGLVPVDQVEVLTVHLTPPITQQEETLWDDIQWFFRGLFA